MFRQAKKTTTHTNYVMCWPHQQQKTFARAGLDVSSAIKQVEATWLGNSTKPSMHDTKSLLQHFCRFWTSFHIIQNVTNYSFFRLFFIQQGMNVSAACPPTLTDRPYLALFKLINPYPTAFPYGNGMVLHFYQQQESSTTKTVHKVINKGLKADV